MLFKPQTCETDWLIRAFPSLFVALFSLYASGLVHAENTTTETHKLTTFVDGCRIAISVDAESTDSQSDYLVGYCNGYLQAAFTQLSVWRDLSSSFAADGICLPSRFRFRETAMLVIDYADKNPDYKDGSLYSLVYMAFLGAYACSSQ